MKRSVSGELIGVAQRHLAAQCLRGRIERPVKVVVGALLKVARARPSPTRCGNSFPGGRLRGANIDVSPTPVTSTVGAGLAWRCVLVPDACAASGPTSVETSNPAAERRDAMSIVRCDRGKGH